MILRLESAIGQVPGIHAVDCYRAGTVGGTEDSEQFLPRGNLGQLIQGIGQGTGNVEIVLEPGPIAGLGIQERGHVLIYNIFLSSFIAFARALSVSSCLANLRIAIVTAGYCMPPASSPSSRRVLSE